MFHWIGAFWKCTWFLYRFNEQHLWCIFHSKCIDCFGGRADWILYYPRTGFGYIQIWFLVCMVAFSIKCIFWWTRLYLTKQALFGVKDTFWNKIHILDIKLFMIKSSIQYMPPNRPLWHGKIIFKWYGIKFMWSMNLECVQCEELE